MKSCREETISFKAPYIIISAESFLADNLPVVVYYFFWGGEWSNETNKQNYNWGHNLPWQRGESDLVVGLITAPLGIFLRVLESLISLSEKRCMFHFSYPACTASLLSLSALALDRYVAITYPLFYRSKLNAKRSLLVSAGVWTVSVLLSMIYFAVGYDKSRFVFANTAVVVTFVLLFTTRNFKVLASSS